MTSSMNLLNNIWYQKHHKHPLFYVLLPFSYLYQLAIFLKQLAYRLHLKKITHPPVPTIVIGNLTVGGTGKTPLVIALTQALSTQGYKPGIVSRGYGGKSTSYPLSVFSHTDPQVAGDEPVLMARKANCPVIVDPNRVRAVEYLLKQHHCNIVLSDDGLQHTALGRDIEIVVVDGLRGFGNNHCLPAGPLREPISRLNTVDFVVMREVKKPETHRTYPKNYFSMRLIPGEIYNLKSPAQIFDTKKYIEKNEPIHALAGIGNPNAFFEQLRAMGFSVIEHAFADHHNYTASDIDFGANTTILMTEKDAIKCEKFAQSNQWCLPVIMDCDSMLPDLLDSIKSVSRTLTI